MVPDQSSPEVREAVEELQLYLSDILPPLVVADSFKLLIKQPPDLVATHVKEWTYSHYRPGGEFLLSDYISFAMKKVNVIGEFRLVPREPFERFLEALKTLVLEFCPPAEREALARNLTRLSESAGSLVGSVDALIRHKTGFGPAAAAAPAATSAPVSAEEMRGVRRFSLLLEHLGQVAPGEGGAGPVGAESNAFAQALAAAARTSRTSGEFDQNLEKIREKGFGVEPGDIFRSLGTNLPGWVPPDAGAVAEGPGASPPAESGPVEAMHLIVVQPEDPGEVGRRFNAMVKSAVERFNDGALPQAVTMLNLAERIVAEKRVDSAVVEAVRSKGDEPLDPERLRKYSETQKLHGMLRRVLNFFAATCPKGLLTELSRELKRERRRLLLQLLEVHGAPVREEALEHLRAPFGQAEGDDKWYYRRNLLYLLRRIPGPPGADLPEEDVDTAARHAVLRFPAPLVKEAVANLGQLKHPRAEKALLSLLQELESKLGKPDAGSDPRETRLVLDRVVAALARFGSADSHRAVVEHGLKKKAELGETMARLSELAGQDLSGEPDVVERLLAALKANAPRRVLGLVLQQSDQNARHIIEALSTTPLPDVREAFENLAGRFSDREIGKAASTALAGMDVAARAPEPSYDARSGELERFGLPALVQNLSEAGLSGLLTIKDSRGEAIGEIVLRGGRMKSTESGPLKGEEAFYQLMEKPAPGFYLFVPKTRGAGEDEPSLQEVLPLCLEGMRRYDELQQLSAVVRDDARLSTTAVRPDHHPDERDGMFVNGLWKLASTGSTPAQCEAAMAADAYRVRRQLAFWVETGALTGA